MPIPPVALARATAAAAFAGMGVVHFVPDGARGMRAMVRLVGLPFPAALVSLTGACELAGAAGLLVPALRRPAGVALITFLAAVFPANAEAAKQPDRFGVVAVPFVPRLALQCGFGALVAWVAFA